MDKLIMERGSGKGSRNTWRFLESFRIRVAGLGIGQKGRFWTRFWGEGEY